MAEPRQPEDHKSKVEPFKFKGADGKQHTLPSITEGKRLLPGRALRDAVLGGDEGQIAYLFKVLEAADIPPKTLDALYDLPEDKMLEVINSWGEYGDGDGASLGESSRS